MFFFFENYFDNLVIFITFIEPFWEFVVTFKTGTLYKTREAEKYDLKLIYNHV